MGAIEKISKVLKSFFKKGMKGKYKLIFLGLILLGVFFIFLLSSHFRKPFPFPTGPIPMVRVEGGTFKRFTLNGNKQIYQHIVEVDSFWIGKYEITQAQWALVMSDNPSREKGANRPVSAVSWFDAVEFCNRLSQKANLSPVYMIRGDEVTCDLTKNGYRLPTEAEWEFAARGGNLSLGYKYAGSDNYREVSRVSDEIHDVGGKNPNELGLYDMSGNVAEWCWDLYDGNDQYYYRSLAYRETIMKNPTGPVEGTDRVTRGGGNLYQRPVYSRCYLEPELDPHNNAYQYSKTGFRVVRTITDN